MTGVLCERWGRGWVCTLLRGHDGPCPVWPVHWRLMCRLFSHDFYTETMGVHGRWPSDRCRRCGYPKHTEAVAR